MSTYVEEQKCERECERIHMEQEDEYSSTPGDHRAFGSGSGLFLAGCRRECLAESVAAKRMSSCRSDCKAAIRVVQRQCEQSPIHVIISHRLLLLACLPSPSPIPPSFFKSMSPAPAVVQAGGATAGARLQTT